MACAQPINLNLIEKELSFFSKAYLESLEIMLKRISLLSIEEQEQLFQSENFLIWLDSVINGMREDAEEMMKLIYSYYQDRFMDIYLGAIADLTKYVDEDNFALYKILYPGVSQSQWGSEVIYYSYLHADSKTVSTQEWIPDFIQAILFDMEQWAKEDGVSSELKYIGCGAHSIAYQIGNYVLKIGSHHDLDKEVSSKYVSQPTLYKTISDCCVIEVNNFVEMVEDNDDEAVLQELYNHLSDDGIYWLDCHTGNIGKLIRPNIPRYTNLTPLGYQFLGIQKEFEHSADVGELVLIDLECLFSRNKYQSLQQLQKEYWIVNVDEDILKLERQYQKRSKR